MKDDILISIITVVYNRVGSIENTIKSVLQQDYDLMEYIVIDGASTDGTLDILQKYSEQIVLVSEKDRGISDAFNKGIKIASGELIFFLNAGDCFVNSSIIRRTVQIWSNNQTDILFYRVVVGEKTYIPTSEKKEDQRKIWESGQIPHQGTFVRKKIFEEVGNFNVFIKIRMDFDFFARCIRNNCTYQYIPDIIVRYEVGGTSMQTENAKRFYIEGIAIKLMYQMKIKCEDFVYLCVPNCIRNMCKRVLRW